MNAPDPTDDAHARARWLLSLLVGGGPRDPDLQAGSLGMSPHEAVRRYLRSPGQLFGVLRAIHDLAVADVASATNIPEDRLSLYETTDEKPSPQHMVALAKFFQADLRMLMQTFGQIGDDAMSDSMSIAGVLTEDEKVDLRILVGVFAAWQPER